MDREPPQTCPLIPYAWLHPCEGFESDPSTGDEIAESALWQTKLHTYRLGHRRWMNAQILPIGVVHDGQWFCDCVQYLPMHWQKAPWMAELAGYRLLHQQGAGLERMDPWPTEQLPGQWCVLNDIVGHRNLAHFFADLLPQLVAIRRLKKRYPELQVLGSRERYDNLQLLRECLVQQGWHSRPAAPLGKAPRLDVDECFIQPLAFNGGVGFLGHPSDHWWMAVDDFREGVEWLRDALEPDPVSVWRNHWVCFSRDLHAPTEAPQGRQFSNYRELLERLSNAGVLVIDPGQYNIRQLQLVVAEARGFIGIHGAGLINGILARPGAQVIEIMPATGCWRMLELLGCKAGLKWHAVMSANDTAQPGSSVIPIESVLHLISS